MRTLRQIGEFVGIPEDSREFNSPADIGLRLAGDLLSSIGTDAQIRSLRGIDGLLQTLVPFTLDASLLDSSGVEPLEARIRLVSSPGLILSTRVLYFMAGQLRHTSQNYGAAGGDVTPTQLGPGQWDIIVRRSGIGPTGYHRLDKSFRANVARRPSPPPPPVVATRPHIQVQSSGPANATMYTVTGTDFLRNQPPNQQGITVRAVDGVDSQNWVMIFTGSDAGGAINLTLGPLNTNLLPRNAAGQAIVNFSATDKRRDPSSVPANEPLWSNTVTFRY